MTDSYLIQSFKQAARSTGLELPAEVIPDGTLHRFTVAKDRASSKNGWYVLHTDAPAAGAFGCWKRGISDTWCAESCQSLAPHEQALYAAKIKSIKQQRENERLRIQSECRTWCIDAWNKAKDATNANPYLKGKGVHAYGLKSFRDTLLVPVQDADGTIHGIQFIVPDGSKNFKTGTSKKGHFFRIGSSEGNIIIICEGYATGASIHEATGYTIFVAFDAGNLFSVAQNIRSQYPDAKIIIASDDDHATQGNPGMVKAREAARAVNGFLAFPDFPDNRKHENTDFNDMARLYGLEAVRSCIDTATEADVSIAEPRQGLAIEAVLARLAALSPLEYEQARKGEAKALGVRTTALDNLVTATRQEKSKTGSLPFVEVEPWDEPVDPEDLLTTIAATIRRFVVCDEAIANAVALWVAMTWFMDIVQVAPLAVITAPSKRCGKSVLLSLMSKLSARAISASNISPAVLYRAVEAWSPSLFIDEADSFLRDNEELRGILNAGHTRDSAFVVRCDGDKFTPTKFSVWGAKAIAGIGRLADTIEDRSIILELRRKLPYEKAEKVRHAEPELFNKLRSKLARFAEDYSEQVRQARPNLPESLNDRAQDNWEPLLAIAMTACNEWLQTGTRAALKLSGSGVSTIQTIGEELLSDIQEIFEEHQIERISTADLITALCADEEKPWSSYNHGKAITPKEIAKRLKSYGIHSKNLKRGSEVFKGYEKKAFVDTFSRYIPKKNKYLAIPPDTTRYPLPDNNINILSDILSATKGVEVADRKSLSIRNNSEVAGSGSAPFTEAEICFAKDDFADFKEVAI